MQQIQAPCEEDAFVKLSLREWLGKGRRIIKSKFIKVWLGRRFFLIQPHRHTVGPGAAKAVNYKQNKSDAKIRGRYLHESLFPLKTVFWPMLSWIWGEFLALHLSFLPTRWPVCLRPGVLTDIINCLVVCQPCSACPHLLYLCCDCCISITSATCR